MDNKPIKIAVCNSRTDKKYKNKTLTWTELKERCKTPIRTTETAEEYPKLPKAEQDRIKDIGGFVGGHLKEGVRKNGNVICRQIGVLDADNIPDNVDLPFLIELSLPNTDYFIYSTHKHKPTAPRLRIAILLSREVSEEEYPAVMRMIASNIGMDYMDDSTYQANRMMYWPSCSSNGEFTFVDNKGSPLNPDEYLTKLHDWRDCSLWPTSKRQSEVIQRTVIQQQDPLAKDGIIGAFCRTYSIQDAISGYLSKIYAPSAMDGRYDYIPADSSAGVVIYDDKFAYSHHATDPACDRLLNAFDLVRIHTFPDLDEKASFKAMSSLSMQDDKIKKLMSEERKAEAEREFSDDNDDWINALEYVGIKNGKGELKNSIHNLTLILENDPKLKGLVFNQLSDSLEIRKEVPWKHPSRFWRDADDAQLVTYVDKIYGTFSARNYEVAVTKVADDRAYHPIREYLDNLPAWDGVPRADALLIDYLGAEDSVYTREATRKTLCAAVCRVRNPGIKFDTMLVFVGPQGIGKSTLIAKLGGDWFSDSLSLSDTKDKTAAEKLQGYWIFEIGELAGMRKMEVEILRSFLSRQNDIYRASFGRRIAPHLRQCVFFGTTNAKKGFLRDAEGNRRFWPVDTPGAETLRGSWDITKDDVKQIWAEILTYVDAGEKLYLSPKAEEYAKDKQREAMESDDREGMVREYLETLLPENWAKLELSHRVGFLDGGEMTSNLQGTVKRKTVANIEIWVECFRRDRNAIKRQDSYEISAIMARIGGWTMSKTPVRLGFYGPQKSWVRHDIL
ncbi:hypothetical protein FACS1894105_04420 [Clostridia bacterium]|nr:hypothetical protein FACS1894105_04420 [Clostridia bacterium]